MLPLNKESSCTGCASDQNWPEIVITITPSNVETLLTKVLTNSLAHLEALRIYVEKVDRKHVPDVRQFDTMGTELLRGVEAPVTYTDLVAIINHMTTGLARRVVALES